MWGKNQQVWTLLCGNEFCQVLIFGTFLLWIVDVFLPLSKWIQNNELVYVTEPYFKCHIREVMSNKNDVPFDIKHKF